VHVVRATLRDPTLPEGCASSRTRCLPNRGPKEAEPAVRIRPPERGAVGCRRSMFSGEALPFLTLASPGVSCLTRTCSSPQVARQPRNRETMKIRNPLSLACAVLVLAWGGSAQAVSSAELYTAQSYQYGRFEARIRFAPGSGVVGAFFLWKDGSELDGTFWNELDFEKVGADCRLETNAFYGDPAAVHVERPSLTADLCSEFHTYAYEWTPEYLAWFVDEVEVRRDTGEPATAYRENATAGMQLRFNIWPGDASYGGVLDPSILPVYQYVDWVEYSSYTNGSFELAWREDFDADSLPEGWAVGFWASSKNLSVHSAQNVGVVDGVAVLALTADDAVGIGATSSGGAGAAGATSTGGAGAPGTGGRVTPIAPEPAGDEGCGCRMASSGHRNEFGLSLLLGAIVLDWTRRRRRLDAPER
jgi:endo-1,3-1,4-beta-glycanase ExoK